MTPRLILRAWREDDRAPFAAINADPEVMRFFPATLTGAQSHALIDRCTAELASTGLGFRAVEERASGRLIGFVGLGRVGPDLPLAPAVEIGWRLARPVWGQGFATEAAAAMVEHGFAWQGLAEIVSFTAAGNVASRRVMEKTGLRRDAAADFEHPALPPGHKLRQHVVYRLAARDRRSAQLGPTG